MLIINNSYSRITSGKILLPSGDIAAIAGRGGKRKKSEGGRKEQGRMRTIKRDWEVKRQHRGSGNVIVR
jgi:hypothetical protein